MRTYTGIAKRDSDTDRKIAEIFKDRAKNSPQSLFLKDRACQPSEGLGSVIAGTLGKKKMFSLGQVTDSARRVRATTTRLGSPQTPIRTVRTRPTGAKIKTRKRHQEKELGCP